MRTKRTVINFITDFLPQIIIAILGIFKMKYFLLYLGTDNMGLYQFYNQIIAYLFLIEGGIGSAILFRLYKPIVENDKRRIDQLMATAKYLFNFIGLAIVACGLALSFFIKFFIKNNAASVLFLGTTFILYLLSQVILYFTMAERIRFDAEQKRYIPNLIFQITTIIKSVLEIIFVLSGYKLVSVLIIGLISNLLANYFLKIAYKKIYLKIEKTEKIDMTVLKDVKHLFVNTISNLVANNIDILIITKFLGLAGTVLYSTYNYIVETIRQMTDKISGATMASIGNLLSTENEKSYKVFLEMNNFLFYVAMVLCVPIFIVINQFINIWYDGVIETSLILAILFSIILYFQIIKIAPRNFIISAGLFKEVKIYSIIEVIVNLVLSIILVNIIGVQGVLIGTIISFIFVDFIMKPRKIINTLFKKSAKKYYISSVANMIFGLVVGEVLYYLMKFDVANIFTWFVYSVIIFVINFIIQTFYFYLTKQLSFIERLKWLKKGKV